MTTDFAYNWALKRRTNNQILAKEFSRWYGSMNCNANSLAEGWALFEMNLIEGN